MIRPRLLPIVVVLALIAVGCSAGTEFGEGARQPQATPTPEPTATAVPFPTATAIPTATPVPTPTPLPACGTLKTGPSLAAHCIEALPDGLRLACVFEHATFFDMTNFEQTGAVERGEVKSPTQVAFAPELVVLDELDAEGEPRRLAKIILEADDAAAATQGLVPLASLEPDHCSETAGPADDLESLPCFAAPFAPTVGSADGDADGFSNVRMQRTENCTRIVIEGSRSTSFLGIFPPDAMPELDVFSDGTRTVIAPRTDFEPAPDLSLESVGPGELPVVFEDIDRNDVRRLQILHEPAEVRAQVLAGPPRLVIDLIPLDDATDDEPPIVGSTAILRPIESEGDAFTIGDTITVEGWIRAKPDHVPFFRVLALRESTAELEPFYSAGLPFLETDGPLGYPGEESVPENGWLAFRLGIDTTGWIGASHAILIGTESADGFVGSGEIVQVLDADGQRYRGYEFVPSQPVVDAMPTSWVAQG